MTCAVVLPGAGSDDRFVRSAFARPLAGVGVRLVAPAPRTDADVIAGYRAALDEADRSGPLLVGGISLGAHVAARWAAAAPPGLVAGLLLALPAWTGDPLTTGQPSGTALEDGSTGCRGAAPAALAARLTAAQVRAHGLGAALASATAGAPGWLAAELGRAWPRYGAGLAPALDAAAAEPGPTPAELAALDVPVGLAALVDDPVHPLAVATAWRASLPRSELVTVRMAAFGADHEVVGRAAVLAWLRAGGR